jgi:hypothetical protein
MEPWAPLVWDFGSTPSPKGSVPSILTCLGAKLRTRAGTPHIPYMDNNPVHELPYRPGFVGETGQRRRNPRVISGGVDKGSLPNPNLFPGPVDGAISQTHHAHLSTRNVEAPKCPLGNLPADDQVIRDLPSKALQPPCTLAAAWQGRRGPRRDSRLLWGNGLIKPVV